MKAYNFKCACGEEGDRIVVDNKDVVKCSKCDLVMEKIGGPIGGDHILPEPPDPSIKEGFSPFFCRTLGRDIKTREDMKNAYEQMYSKKLEKNKEKAHLKVGGSAKTPEETETISKKRTRTKKGVSDEAQDVQGL